MLEAEKNVLVHSMNSAEFCDRLYDDRQPIEPNYPSTRPSQGERPGEASLEDEKIVLNHAPPGYHKTLYHKILYQ